MDFSQGAGTVPNVLSMQAFFFFFFFGLFWLRGQSKEFPNS
jgi:hypothetical protein